MDGWMDGCLVKKFRRSHYPNDPIHIRERPNATGGERPWPPFCEEEEEDGDGYQGEKHFSTESENEEGNRAICCR